MIKKKLAADSVPHLVLEEIRAIMIVLNYCQITAKHSKGSKKRPQLPLDMGVAVE